MRVLHFYDIENKLSLGNAQRKCTLWSELLNKCGMWISLHVPETPDTKDMMGAGRVRAHEARSIFINAARGTVVTLKHSVTP